VNKRNIFFLGVIFLWCVGACKGVCTDREYVSLAKSLQKNGQLDQALYYYKKALVVNPDNFHANLGLAFELYGQSKWEESLHYFYKIVELVPNNASMLSNIGRINFILGNIKEAMRYFCKSLKCDKSQMELYKQLGVIFLMLGKLDKGYELYDIFYQKDDQERGLWKGENLAGKTIFIFDNVGMGDVFCFIQYAKNMKEQGATVVLGARDGLIPIMSSCPYIDKIVPRFSDFKDFDCYVYMHMLPRMGYKAGFGIPCHVPYLFADPVLVEKWEQVLSQDKNLKIGICWETSVLKNKKTDEIISRDRSIALHYFYELSKLPGVSLYSLQRVNGVDQLEYMPKDFNIHEFDQEFDKTHGSFSDTAAVMKHLDLVITVDTSIAHLAGALGVPVWLLLHHKPNWRWFLEREDSPWYPSMRVFRRSSVDSWETVMKNVLECISKIKK